MVFILISCYEMSTVNYLIVGVLWSRVHFQFFWKSNACKHQKNLKTFYNKHTKSLNLTSEWDVKSDK